MTAVKLDVSDNVAVVTLCCPPVNAISDVEMYDIQQMFQEIGERKDVRAAVLTGAGIKHFCAGVNLKTLSDRGSPSLSWEMDLGRGFREALWAVMDCPMPVIGAINGVAIGAGLALASVCDVLVASDNASFATTEINVGLLGAYTHLKMLVGRYKAREYFFSGERISAQELKEIGAVSRVVSADELMNTAIAMATSFSKKSPYALRLAKEAMNECEDLSLKEAYHLEQHYTERLLRFNDAEEARSAFFEKRKPVWEWDLPD